MLLRISRTLPLDQYTKTDQTLCQNLKTRKEQKERLLKV